MDDTDSHEKVQITRARHLSTGLLPKRGRRSQTFSSLNDNPSTCSSTHTPSSSKHSKRYADFSSSSAVDDAYTILNSCTTSPALLDDQQPVESSERLSKREQTHQKSLSADDFVSKMVTTRKQPQQTYVVPQSGEGHCSGACAMIPLDVRPLIKQAYDGTDFTNVDPDPISLPMLGDDGILRRDLLPTD